jgi:hypothetical protein
MECPKCGWHTHDPKVSVSYKWNGCVYIAYRTSKCEKLFCSGSITNGGSYVKDKHSFKDFHEVDRRTNATIRYYTKCTKCGQEKSDNY